MGAVGGRLEAALVNVGQTLRAALAEGHTHLPEPAGPGPGVALDVAQGFFLRVTPSSARARLTEPMLTEKCSARSRIRAARSSLRRRGPGGKGARPGRLSQL